MSPFVAVFYLFVDAYFVYRVSVKHKTWVAIALAKSFVGYTLILVTIVSEPNMQRDTDFTFEDIVGSPDIHDSDISKYGATGMEAPDSTDMLRKLRFLRVPELDPDFGANDVTYTITDGGQYPEVVDYIAVSYCWNSFSQTNTALSDSAPTVSVIDQGVRRSPRCPTEVIFRAVNFAHARGVSLI